MAERIFWEKFGNIKKVKVCTTTADIDFDNYTEPGTYEIYEDMGSGQNRVYFLTVDKSVSGACLKQTRIHCGIVDARQTTTSGAWTDWTALSGGGSADLSDYYTKYEIDTFRVQDEMNMERHVGMRLDEAFGEYIPPLENDIGALEEQVGDIETALDDMSNTPTDSKYFDIDYDGVISLKPEYRGRSTSASYPYSISDRGSGNDGSKNSELPKRIVIPEIIGDTVVIGFQDGMFYYNYAVEEIAIPDTVTVIPDSFCRNARHLRAIKNTEQVTKIGGTKAFMNTRIGEAIFPNLKELGDISFIQCSLMYVADIGNEITEIPAQTFQSCHKLSLVKGGAKVTKINANAFNDTFNLKNLSFLPQVTSIGEKAFYSSRIQFDWASIQNTCTFGTYATPIADNTTDYWSNCTYTPCENRLITLLHQCNPEWANETYGTTSTTYANGCSVMSIMHIHSAYTGEEYTSPKDFETKVLKDKTYPSDLDTPEEIRGEPLLSMMPIKYVHELPFLKGLGYDVTEYRGVLTQSALQDVFNSLYNGEYVIISKSASDINGGHSVVLYGVNNIGEVLVADSDTAIKLVELYDEGLTYHVPFQNITGPDSDIWIVRNK